VGSPPPPGGCVARHCTRRKGLCEKWANLGKCPRIKELCQNVNGPLLWQLAERVGHRDTSCGTLFRDGVCIAFGGRLGDWPVVCVVLCLQVPACTTRTSTNFGGTAP